ncbi:MAG: periplasmic heavy metal sensor [Deltaproteobacteria bacterium]|nr:periplasmic heavy metal sensor [Deltaproteobacteria bacterium]
MLKKILTGVLFMALIGTPFLAMGQDRPAGKWWRLPRVSKELHLRKDEKNELDDLFIENRRKLIDLKSELERARLDLDALLDRGSLDDDAVRRQYDRLERARENLARERFRFLLEVRRILGPERFDRLKRMYRQFRVQRRKNAIKRRRK